MTRVLLLRVWARWRHEFAFIGHATFFVDALMCRSGTVAGRAKRVRLPSLDRNSSGVRGIMIGDA